MSGNQSLRALPGNAEELLQCHWFTQALAQRPAFDVLHDQEHLAAVLDHVVYRRHMPIHESRRPLRLLLKPPPITGIDARFRRRALQRNHPLQLQILRPVHFSHSARAHTCFDHKTTSNSSGQKVMLRDRLGSDGPELAHLEVTLRKGQIAPTASARGKSYSPRSDFSNLLHAAKNV